VCSYIFFAHFLVSVTMQRSYNQSTSSLELRNIPQDSEAPINPFTTPHSSRAPSIYSQYASTIGISSGYHYESAVGKEEFRSRRIRKENCVPLPIRKKKPKERLLWIMPLMGIFIGLGITGFLVYLKLSSRTIHKFCSVFSDDFSSGTLDKNLWTAEIEVGGYG